MPRLERAAEIPREMIGGKIMEKKTAKKVVATLIELGTVEMYHTDVECHLY